MLRHLRDKMLSGKMTPAQYVKKAFKVMEAASATPPAEASTTEVKEIDRASAGK